jgi:hypothetical protein
VRVYMCVLVYVCLSVGVSTSICAGAYVYVCV